MPLYRRRRRGGLEWGIRESLTRYVSQLPDGLIVVDDDAGIVRGTHPPRFWFPEASRDVDVLRYRGSVSISAHGGMLRVRARDPWVSFGEADAVISVIVGDGARQEVAIAPLRLDIGPQVGPARLTAGGAVWLGPSYAEGGDASSVRLWPSHGAT